MSFFQQYLEPSASSQVQQNSQITHNSQFPQNLQNPQNPQIQINPNSQPSIQNNANHQVTVSQKERPKFEDYVKKYIEVDNEIESLQERLKTMRDWKRKLNGVIVKHLEEQKLTDHTLEVNDGTLRYYEKKEYSSMTFTYIEKCLHDMIPEQEQVKYVIQYLKDNRDVKIVPELKRRKYSSESSSDSENE